MECAGSTSVFCRAETYHEGFFLFFFNLATKQMNSILRPLYDQHKQARISKRTGCLYIVFPGQILCEVISHDSRTTWQRAEGELRREAARQYHRLLVWRYSSRSFCIARQQRDNRLIM